MRKKLRDRRKQRILKIMNESVRRKEEIWNKQANKKETNE